VKVLLQRVKRAEVRVDGERVGRIGKGLLVMVGVETAMVRRMPTSWPTRRRSCGSSPTSGDV